MRNHLGSFECKLCLTLHNNEGNYIAHTQGKKHTTNLKRRQLRDTKNNVFETEPIPVPTETKKLVMMQGSIVKIGRPAFR